MPNKMLIDASHPEETRVVVTRGNRIEEFDFESQDKKQLKGNIYLARVTRVEPSLQAAFVEYGGNRHGFLAFSEIHPDYYQIPVADRQALLQAEAEEARQQDEEDEAEQRAEGGRSRRRKRGRGRARDEGSEAEAVGAEGAEEAGDAPAIAAAVDADVIAEEVETAAEDENDAEDAVEDVGEPNGDDQEGAVESVGAEDALEELPNRRKIVRRQYKIQEVIKRRQILLVQVVKEERGNKGAALTTYLSLAGRYSVLMPNTARGGGISRKITNAQDRKRLKSVVKDLEVPEGMGVILRTAGANRTKAEIKRDYEYLMRLWENVRTLTLQSTAPSLVYEEGSLIKRSVRDLYNKDIDEILVSGDDGYREAKDFMRMLMPSHAKVVQPYREIVPIFARQGIEAQLDRMLQPQVTLKSGGYIIINQTEALVSIDVNSGRSTKEHSIEDTALQTNLEAAEEVARQLRLRDLAGLIVIDFIDMEEKRNNRAVEKRLKDHLKNDRARIQVGRISHFGLLEMSRQRIRASVLESTMKPCPHCGGTGHIRSDSSVALHVVRAIEEYLLKDARHHIVVRTPVATALYVLNHKRANIADLEARFGLTITIEADESVGTQHYAISRGAAVERPVTIPIAVAAEEEPAEIDDTDILADDEVEEAQGRSEERGADEGRGRKRKRRRRRRGGRDRDAEQQASEGAGDEPTAGDGADEEPESAEAAFTDDEAGAEEPKKRRRGKRGGRRNRPSDEDAAQADSEAAADASVDAVAEEAQPASASPAVTEETVEAPAPVEAEAETAAAATEEAPQEKPKKRAPRRKAKKDEAPAEEAAPASGEAVPEPVSAEAEAAPAVADEAPAEPEKKRRPSRRAAAATVASEVEPVVTSSESAEETKPKRTGWWQKKTFF